LQSIDMDTVFLTVSFGILLCIAFAVLVRKKRFEDVYKYKIEHVEFVNDGKQKKYVTSDPSECVDLRLTKSGLGSHDESPPLTIFELLRKAISNNAHSAMLAKEHLNKHGDYDGWRYTSRQELYQQVQCAARGFIACGLREWEAVCIMGFNAPQWFIADLAAIYGGGIACGLYTTNNAGQCRYIINDCNARILVVENGILLDKFVSIQQSNAADMARVTTIIVWDDTRAVQQYNADYPKSQLTVVTWNDFMRTYGQVDIAKYDAVIEQRQRKINAGNCCTLIYTSGTTGTPKGVMLSHDNLIWTVKTILSSQKHIQWWGKGAVTHSIVSYLPLSHIAAQALDIYGPLLIGYHGGDGTIFFGRTDALKGSLIKTLLFAKPTVFLGVPRVWEKIESKMRLIGKKGNFLVKFVSRNAKAIGLTAAHNKQLGGNKQIPFLFPLVNALIFSTIRKKLGFERLQLAMTGAAPIASSTMSYFHSVGINLIEGYGMSESTAIISMGLPYYNKIGCTGPPLLGVDCRVDVATQELLAKGRNVMMGYLNNAPKTKSVVDERGYLHTGDMGAIEQRSKLVFITGRLKELIITKGGENIAPVPIEDEIKALLPGISHCVLIGDQRKYLTALLTLKTENEDSVQLYSDAGEVDATCVTVSDAKQSKVWQEYIAKGIQTYNQNSDKCVSNATRIQYFRILDRDFCEAEDEMTSTLKLKRSVISQKYKPIIDSMY